MYMLILKCLWKGKKADMPQAVLNKNSKFVGLQQLREYGTGINSTIEQNMLWEPHIKPDLQQSWHAVGNSYISNHFFYDLLAIYLNMNSLLSQNTHTGISVVYFNLDGDYLGVLTLGKSHTSHSFVHFSLCVLYVRLCYVNMYIFTYLCSK